MTDRYDEEAERVANAPYRHEEHCSSFDPDAYCDCDGLRIAIAAILRRIAAEERKRGREEMRRMAYAKCVEARHFWDRHGGSRDGFRAVADLGDAIRALPTDDEVP